MARKNATFIQSLRFIKDKRMKRFSLFCPNTSADAISATVLQRLLPYLCKRENVEIGYTLHCSSKLGFALV